MTILCYSRVRYVFMQEIATLKKEGYNSEVVHFKIDPAGRPEAGASRALGMHCCLSSSGLTILCGLPMCYMGM